MTVKTRKSSRKSRPKKRPASQTAQFEKLLRRASSAEHYLLKLYITGTTARSNQAVANVRSLCEEYLPGRYELQVVDIYQMPKEAAEEQIIAAPTLIKVFPNPPKRLIGNLADRDKVLIGLNLRTKGKPKDGERATQWATL